MNKIMKEGFRRGYKEGKEDILIQLRQDIESELKEAFTDEAVKYRFSKVIGCDLDEFYFATLKRLLKALKE